MRTRFLFGETNLDEDDRRTNGQETVELAQDLGLCTRVIAIDGGLSNGIGKKFRGAICQGKEVCIRCILVGVLPNVVRHRGREEHKLHLPRQHTNRRKSMSCPQTSRAIYCNLPSDAGAIITRAILRKHLIGLVEDQHLEPVNSHLLTLDAVYDGTRGTNDH